MQVTAEMICQVLGGTLEGDPEVIVTHPSKIEEGKEGSISFIANPKYAHFAYDTKASVLLVGRDFNPDKPVSATLIRVDNVYQSLALLLNKFGPKYHPKAVISPRSEIHPTASLGKKTGVGHFTVIEEKATIGNGTLIYPNVFIGKNVRIGNNTIIHSGVRILADCVIGDNCCIHPNTVVGSDGFGYYTDKNGHYHKIAQIGNVIIEDNVEIGANTVIDRATMGSTIIRTGARLDNLIQIAHNVEIGAHTAIAAQAGIAGSTSIGKQCTIGGQAGFVGHISIADGTKIQAQSGVAASVKEKNTAVYGSPALKYIEFLKAYAVFKKLPDLQKQMQIVHEKLEQLERE